jgi:hypothetical protein
MSYFFKKNLYFSHLFIFFNDIGTHMPLILKSQSVIVALCSENTRALTFER